MKIILILLLIAIAVIVILAMRKPDITRHSRSILIKATPAQIYPHIQSLQKYNAWNPWAAADPSVVNTHSGADEGVGAVMEWTGKKSGQGRMEVREVNEPNLVSYDLQFIKPVSGKARADFHLEPKGDQTEVTWAFEAENGFASKVFQVFANMEKMLGNSFDDGLSRLKAIVEAE